MKVFFDKERGNIVVDNRDRFFANGSLQFVQNGDKIELSYKNSNYILFSRDYFDYQKEDGTSAGANVTEVSNYLDSQFKKVQSANSFCRYELTTDQTLNVDVSGGVNDLIFDFELFNTNTNVFSNSGGTVTILQDGIYNISTCVILESPTLQAISKSQIGVFVNGALRAIDTQDTTLAAGNEVTALNLNTLVNVVENDTIVIKVSLFGVSSSGRGLRLVNLFGTTANNLSNVSISKL